MSLQPPDNFYVKRTLVGRVVYDRPEHSVTYRNIDQIIARKTGGTKLSDPPKKWRSDRSGRVRFLFPLDFDRDSLGYVENSIKNLNSVLLKEIESEQTEQTEEELLNIGDMLWEGFKFIIGLLVPEWVVEALQIIYNLTPRFPGHDPFTEENLMNTFESIKIIFESQFGEGDN